MLTGDEIEAQAAVKRSFRKRMGELSRQAGLTDEEYWVRQNDLALEALGALARLKQGKGVDHGVE